MDGLDNLARGGNAKEFAPEYYMAVKDAQLGLSAGLGRGEPCVDGSFLRRSYPEPEFRSTMKPPPRPQTNLSNLSS